MKKRFIIYLLGIGAVLSSCSKSFLDEDPLSIYTPDNSLQSSIQFQQATNNLYNGVRNIYMGNMNLDTYFGLYYATDFAYNGTDYDPAAKLNAYKATMVPSYLIPGNIWTAYYKIISNANLIISQLNKSTQLSDADKNSYMGQALFFRAYCYNVLANLFGGVPLELNELSAPRYDYVRATRDAVYQQCKKDLLQAIGQLSDINQVPDGTVNKQIAKHVLTEVLISLKDYDGAIASASEVISYSGVSLMNSRFGRRANLPGDVYRDLFEYNNQNYSTGNHEGLLVIQTALNNSAAIGDQTAWAVVPSMGGMRITETTTKTKMNLLFNAKFVDSISSNGIGWIRPTSHFFYEIWTPGDIRNSSYNIVRDIRISGVPATSPDYGKWYVKDGYKAKVAPADYRDTIRNFYPIIRKASPSAGDFVSAAGPAILSNQVNPFGGFLLNGATRLFIPKYMARLAETYLLRAEAYLGKGQTQLAADDINVLRNRAQATPATAGEINIDYILDERLRELYMEEFRAVTLTRLGLLYDRDKRYNPKSGQTIEMFHNLWPIPSTEITQNTGAVLEQNKGYN
ncbi:RagB/SusD family nutrient uptake outer membrane protein [Chitinophaga qingshengii]|uniref:RagB/SusD family nutrient uptake outer membrane protein n=1 Tax=Chitinophaga qingshengii TaxID=1569794 RepID=A0ABR7TQL1_9BACT|nr:RagB/SusD family nutrient uptake outer membrane protein [Chitinophaga qingshengii]MBC9932765.1 RagB/SusD family nutrient uptake outer membrane protein [Chitinophaga qingshengii]